MAEKKKNFEESLKKLEKISTSLKAEDITLEDAIKQGMQRDPAGRSATDRNSDETGVTEVVTGKKEESCYERVYF